MPVLLEGINISEVGVYEIRQTLTVQVTAEQARLAVNRWLLDEVSYMMHAESPTLVINGNARWRVPAVLTAPHVGAVGAVGAVDVDAATGELLEHETQKEIIVANARKLAKTLPPFSGPRETPAEYLATDAPPAPSLVPPDAE